MKALTLTQPWASLMANGSKVIETRSWRTNYRGQLVIHAAKGYPVWARNLAHQPHFRYALGVKLDVEKLPRGVGLCVVELLGCVPTTELYKAWFLLGHKPSANEIPFGDYTEGRWAWVTRFVRALPDGPEVRGAQGLWDWPEEGGR